MHDEQRHSGSPRARCTVVLTKTSHGGGGGELAARGRADRCLATRRAMWSWPGTHLQAARGADKRSRGGGAPGGKSKTCHGTHEVVFSSVVNPYLVDLGIRIPNTDLK